MVPSSQVASNNGHGWLDNAMGRLKQEPVVCVRVQREMILQKPITLRGAAADGSDTGADAGAEEAAAANAEDDGSKG